MARKILRIIHLYMSNLKKRDENLYVFGSWWGNKFADNSKYLFLHAYKKGLNAVWVTKNRDVYRELKNLNLPVVMHDSAEGIRICKKAKYYFYSTSLADISDEYAGGAVLVNLWHGIPLKKIMYDNSIDNPDLKLVGKIRCALTTIPLRKKYVVSTSTRISEIYSSAFKIPSCRVLQLGQPRNDCFFDGTIKRKKYFDLDYNRLCVYMPTHRNEGKSKIEIDKIMDLGKLNEMCKKSNTFFLIKKHYYHKNEKERLDEFTNIIDITDYEIDTQELLYNTDILITDYSSCYIDFLLLDKPIIFYAYDYEEYLINDREMYFEYTSVAPGPIAYDNKTFLNILSSVILNDDSHVEKRHQIRNLFYSSENQKQVSDKILSCLGELDDRKGYRKDSDNK